MDVFRKCLNVFVILHDCVDRSCVFQLSLNEYMMMMMSSLHFKIGNEEHLAVKWAKKIK